MRKNYRVLIIIVTLFLNHGALFAEGPYQTLADGKKSSSEPVKKSKSVAGSDFSRFRLKQPSAMEKQWRDYRDFLERRNLIRSPNNPESDLEYMLREFF